MKPKRLRRLKVGDKVPSFWTRDINGREVDSSAFEGYTLLAFLRYAGCPFCNMAIYRLAHEYRLLKRQNCQVVAFIQSTEGNIEKNVIGKQDATPPFPIIPDQDQDFYKLFGVAPNILKTVKYSIRNASQWMDATMKKGFTQGNVDGNAFMVPAFFLIDKNGIIQMADYEANFYEDSTFTSIYEVLNFGASQTLDDVN